MATFNRAGVLRATLEAMCRVRTEGLSVELVVVDNASTDATPRVLKEFAGRLPLRCLREEKAGKSNALNRALEPLNVARLPGVGAGTWLRGGQRASREPDGLQPAEAWAPPWRSGDGVRATRLWLHGSWGVAWTRTRAGTRLRGTTSAGGSR